MALRKARWFCVHSCQGWHAVDTHKHLACPLLGLASAAPFVPWHTWQPVSHSILPRAQLGAVQLCCCLRWCRRALKAMGRERSWPAVNKHCSSVQARHLPGTTRGWRDCSLLQFLTALIKNPALFLFKHSQHTQGKAPPPFVWQKWVEGEYLREGSGDELQSVCARKAPKLWFKVPLSSHHGLNSDPGRWV